MIKSLTRSTLALATLPLIACAAHAGDSQVIGTWKFKTMDLGAAAASPRAQEALKQVQKANPTIDIRANHRFFMRFGKVEEGSWRMKGPNAITFTVTKVADKSVTELRKQFQAAMAKNPQMAKVMAKQDPFAPITATLSNHGKLLIFKAKQKSGDQMIFAKGR